MVRYLSAALALSLLGLGAGAQSSPTQVPHVHQAKIVDGAVHPELIPEVAAYRLFFLAVSPPSNASFNDRSRQNAHVQKIGLSNDDSATLISLLAEFRTAYDAFVIRWNNAASNAVAKNEPFNVAPFVRERDLLVQSTQTKLGRTLTSDGWVRLQLHVNSEKSKMKVAEEGQ
jgi:hypothetical protein